MQITARSDRDLTPEGIVQKVADASGAKYSAASEAQPPVNVFSKPSVATKPVFTPKRTGVLGPSAMPATGPAPGPAPAARAGIDDDGWGPDAPPVSRTELEKVQPAYKPTKVNLQELRSQSQNQPAATFNNERDVAADTPGVVKGGYQPVGKVDIDAIRRQAREAGDVRDERPEPVRGTYEPVGKVDIAAIRAKAQKPSDATRPTEHAPAPFSERQTTGGSSERLVSLPKPKVANKFGAAPAFAGTKPPLPTGFGAATTPSAAPVGIASRTFADEGGKTPAQLWAERKARERGASGAHDSSSGPSTAAPIPSQTSGSGQWKSSYSGKSWAPVQTTPTGKSAGNDVSVPRAELANEEDRELESQPSVSAIREQLSSQTERVSHPGAQRNIPMPGLASGPTEPEAGYEAETEQPVPTPPPQPRSPTPPTPAEVREASPIRVAMPVGRAVADAHEEQQSSAPAMPVESLQEAVPAEEELEEPAHDIGRAAAEVTANDPSRTAGVRAVVQYDYEKAEDNEIELREGEYVTDIEMVDKDWWLGVNAHGERGLFPSNYVEILEGDQEEEQPSSTAVASHEAAVAEPDYAAESQHQPHAAATGPGGGPTATALYDYEAAEDNEISFPEGALITDLVRIRSSLIPVSPCSQLTVPRRNSPMTTGGWESSTARKVSFRRTMYSSMSSSLSINRLPTVTLASYCSLASASMFTLGPRPLLSWLHAMYITSIEHPVALSWPVCIVLVVPHLRVFAVF